MEPGAVRGVYEESDALWYGSPGAVKRVSSLTCQRFPLNRTKKELSPGDIHEY